MILSFRWKPQPSYCGFAKLRSCRSVVAVLQAVEVIRRRLENDPAVNGHFLPEGLYYIDEEPLRVFFLIDVDLMVVEVTDFRVL